MSVICARITEAEVEIAADRRLTFDSGATIGPPTTKLHTFGDWAIAVCGTPHHNNLLLEFATGRPCPDLTAPALRAFMREFHGFTKEQVGLDAHANSAFILACSKGFAECSLEACEVLVHVSVGVWAADGSGRDPANALLWAGLDCYKAVEGASRFVTSCGDGVDFLRIPRAAA